MMNIFKSKLSLGGMRFESLEETIKIIELAVKNGITYLETSPAYIYHSADNNSEIWIGQAIKELNCYNKIQISTKSSPLNSNGNLTELEYGYGINTKESLLQVVKQSIKRLQVDYLDWYQLWDIGTIQEFDAAVQNNGWMDGVITAIDLGLIRHLGLTSHGSSEDIISLLETGYFEMITIPFNLINTSRKSVIEYAKKHNILIKIMNPLSGGVLTAESELIENRFSCYEINSLHELSLGYILFHEGTSPLLGVKTSGELKDNLKIEKKYIGKNYNLNRIEELFITLTKETKYFCTGCKYCSPCPKGIQIDRILKPYSIFNLLNNNSALYDFITERKELEFPGYNMGDCVKCGLCEKRCPNKIPIMSELEKINQTLSLYRM